LGYFEAANQATCPHSYGFGQEPAEAEDHTQSMSRWLFLLLTLALAGCASRGTPSGTTLTFWTINLAPTYNSYFEKLKADFEAAHPGVRLVWLDFSQDASRQKLMAGIAAGDPPDLVNLDTEFALTMAQNGALTRLDEYVTPEQRGRYFPNLWAAAQVEGGTYAIPWYVTTRVIMMNRTLMKEAGLDPLRPPQTWEELDSFARQISERTDSIGMMPAIRIVNDWSMAGAPIVDMETLTPQFVNPLAVAAVERYRTLYADGVMPPETLTEGYKGALDRFKAGSLGFLEAGPQFLLRIKADAPSVYEATGLAPLPETATRTVPAATMNFAVPVSSKNRELAVELALFLTSPQAQLEFAKLVPLLPSTIESTLDPYFQTGGEDRLQAEAVRLSLGQLSRCRDFSLALPRQKDLMRALNADVEKAIRGEMSSEQALIEAARAWNTTLAPYRKDEVAK
jgi:putative chitobiose transport system substrate-binding protein